MENFDDVKQPCPFCGGYDALYVGDEQSYNERLDKAVEDGYERAAALTIRCMRCKLRLSIVSDEPYQVAREHLMERWNKRWKE